MRQVLSSPFFIDKGKSLRKAERERVRGFVRENERDGVHLQNEPEPKRKKGKKNEPPV